MKEGKERTLEEIFLNDWIKIEIEKHRKFRRMCAYMWERDWLKLSLKLEGRIRVTKMHPGCTSPQRREEIEIHEEEKGQQVAPMDWHSLVIWQA